MGQLKQSQYVTAKFMGAVLFYAGLLAFAAGLFMGTVCSAEMGDMVSSGAPLLTRPNELALTGIEVSVISHFYMFAFFGLFMAGVGQHVRVSADAARCGEEMLALTRAART